VEYKVVQDNYGWNVIRDNGVSRRVVATYTFKLDAEAVADTLNRNIENEAHA
jgi:hypothetical protein